MSPTSPSGVENANHVTVRYWAAARAAAGVAHEVVDVSDPATRTLAAVLDEVLRRRPGDKRFADVLDICSVLIGEVPVGARRHEDVTVGPGAVVELLPPFAGG